MNALEQILYISRFVLGEFTSTVCTVGEINFSIKSISFLEQYQYQHLEVRKYLKEVIKF
jgi:hypothetical protein